MTETRTTTCPHIDFTENQDGDRCCRACGLELEAETTNDPATIDARIQTVADAIASLENERYIRQFGTPPPHGPIRVHVKPRQKFIAIDIDGSGAWLIERETGEIYNIKAYGVPDRNKKLKADIGNILTVDPARMLQLRYNYLR